MSPIAIAMAAVALLSTPDLGTREGACRSPENGPAAMVHVVGLKDRSGLLRLELYPAVDGDFLADDNLLLAAGKTFARVDAPIAAAGPVEMCIRLPHPGRFALSLLHDRNGNRRFDLIGDGIGFPGNPQLGWSRPRVENAEIVAGAGITRLAIRLNYRRGLTMRPLENR